MSSKKNRRADMNRIARRNTKQTLHGQNAGSEKVAKTEYNYIRKLTVRYNGSVVGA